MTAKTVLLFFLAITISSASQGQSNKRLKEKKFGVTITLPYLNNFRFHHYEKNKDTSSFGFVGVGYSLFYKTSKDKISIGYSLATDAALPVGPIDYFGGTRTKLICSFFEILYHRKIQERFRIVAGINFSKYEYSFFDYDARRGNYKVDKTTGLSFGPEYFNKKNCSIALLYKPAIINFDRKSYKHHLTIDFRFDINIIKLNSPSKSKDYLN